MEYEGCSDFFPESDDDGAYEIDIEVDEYTNCIEDQYGNSYDVCFKEVQYNIEDHEEDAYEASWLFDWKEAQNTRNTTVYDMYIDDPDSDDCRIQSRIAIRLKSHPCYVLLVENAPHNSSQDNNSEGKRQYIGCGLNMFAFACMMAKKRKRQPATALEIQDRSSRLLHASIGSYSNP